MRTVYCVSEKQMKDWEEICKGFCEKFGYKLLFVNSHSCGVELADGTFKHIYINEMEELLK